MSCPLCVPAANMHILAPIFDLSTTILNFFKLFLFLFSFHVSHFHAIRQTERLTSNRTSEHLAEMHVHFRRHIHMLLRINKYTSTHIPAGCVWMCMDFPTAYQTSPRHVWYPHFVRAGLSVLCHAEKSDSKICRTFLFLMYTLDVTFLGSFSAYRT